MKSKLFALVAIAFTSLSGYAYSDQGSYVGILGGLNFQDLDDDFYDIDMDTGYLVGGFAGYKFCNGIRLEGEVAFRHNNIEDFSYEGESLEVGGHAEITTLMANAIYDFDMGCMWTPYLGFGIGYAHTELRMSGYGQSLLEKDDRFAWQGIAGISYSLMCDTDVALEYRFLKATGHWNNNSIGISLKRFF